MIYITVDSNDFIILEYLILIEFKAFQSTLSNMDSRIPLSAVRPPDFTQAVRDASSELAVFIVC